MAPLLLRPGHGLLRCPVCRLELTGAAGALVCRNRHSFDLARAGYVNLLHGQRRRPAMGGDSPAQLRHRAAFLDAGHFDAITSTIAGHVQPSLARAASSKFCVLDAGCGTGHHLAGLAAALTPPIIGLGLDIAKEAARQAARRWPALAFAVADLWSDWPVQDEAVDLVVSIFAPKHFSETARVLRPGGWLAIAYPGPDHMIELRDRFGLMRLHRDMPRRYREMARRFIGAPNFVRLRNRVVLDSPTIRDAILMGPNAHHIAPPWLGAIPHSLAVMLDLTVLFARKA